MGPVGPPGIAGDRVDKRILRCCGIDQGHETGEENGRDVAAWHRGRVARIESSSIGPGMKRHVRDGTGAPTDLEKALCVYGFFIAIAVHILRDAEGDVRHVENRCPLGNENVEAAPERSDVAVQVDLIQGGLLEMEPAMSKLEVRLDSVPSLFSGAARVTSGMHTRAGSKSA